jgi:hypothetical protein
MAYFDREPRFTIVKGEFLEWRISNKYSNRSRIINRFRMIHESGYYGKDGEGYHELFDTYRGLYELIFKSIPIRIYFTVEKMVNLWAGSNDKGNGYYGQDSVLGRLPGIIKGGK